tara:strand:+ start:4621 stop:5490 length:870 start_codon:yes stop_codon:yes gene_type:complete
VAEEQVAVSEDPAASSAMLNADVQTTETAEPVEARWQDNLPDDIRDNPSLQNIPDVATLAKTAIHAQSMVGAEKIPVPGKWATDDDWDQVYTKLGRPAEADGYEFEFGDTPLDDEFVGEFKKTALGAGLSNRQAQKLVGWYMDIAKNSPANPEQQQQQVEVAKLQAEADLKKEYGAAFNDRIAIGDNLINEFGAEGLDDLKLADGTPLLNHPAFVKTIVNAAQYIQESVSEDKLIGDKTSNALTPAEADQKMEELMRKDGPYWDAGHPQHQSYVDQVLELNRQKHPEPE